MATVKEKQKKGSPSSFFSFYRSSLFRHHRKPKSHHQQPDAAVVPQQYSSSSSPHSQSSFLQNCSEEEIKPAVVVQSKDNYNNNNNNLVLKKLQEDCEVQIRICGGRRSVDRGMVRDGNYYVDARKSVSQVETTLGTNMESVISFLQVKVLVSDMPGFMQLHAFRCARSTYDSLEKFSSKHIAFNIKKEFDGEYGPAWHCIVGSGFGSYVTHSTGCFLYFSMEKLYVLVFKTKVQKTAAPHSD